MSSERSTVPLGDVLENLIDHRGRTPKKVGGDFAEAGIQVLSAKNIRAGRLDVSESPRFVIPEIWNRWMPVKLKPGDVLLTSEAPLGEPAYLSKEADYCLGQRLFALRADEARLHPRFLYYLLRSPVTRQRVQARASGTTAQGIRQSELVKVPVDLPSIADQRRIAWILGSLDDKIESNRRIAENLEQIVATLFRARFVDFVGQEDLVDSELGPIPRGWSVASLSEIGAVHRDLGNGQNEIPYIGLDAMPRGSTVLMEWQEAGAPTGQAANFDQGDILFGKLRPYFRKVGVAPIPGRCSTEILVLRPQRSDFYGLLLGHVSSQRFIDHCVAVSRGTRMPRAEWKDAGTFAVAVPPAELAREFTETVRMLYAKIVALTHLSHTLTRIREHVLPRLVSGELRVLPVDGVTAEPA